MSNFICEQCGIYILEDKNGKYITGCEHYPITGKPLIDDDFRASVQQTYTIGLADGRIKKAPLK